MEAFKDEISKLLDEKRQVKASTKKAYITNLQKLLKMLDEEVTVKNLNVVLSNPELVMDALKDKQPSTIRNYLASIVVYLMAREKLGLVSKYRTQMDKYQKMNNEALSGNKKSNKQEKNWSSLEELRGVLKTYKRQLDREGILKKTELNKKQMDLLQKWVVGSLYIADEANPPLRNDYIMEIISFKDYERLNDEQKREKNYLVVKNNTTKMFSLGEYKTSDKYGVKLIPVGKTLNKVLNVWLKYNKSKHLLLNAKGEPMNANTLTKYLIKVFEPTGKKISSSLIRSIYISEKFPPMTQEKTELADAMLHSTSVQGNIYAKE